MKKCALIVFDDSNRDIDNSIGNTLIKGIKKYFHALVPNRIDKIVVDEEQFILYIIKIPKGAKENEKSLIKRITKAFNFLFAQGVGIVAFDSYLMNEYKDYVEASCSEFGINISHGDTIYYPIVIKTLKKLLKAKGIDLNDSDAAIISDEDSRHTEGFIRQLSNHVKYLSCFCNNNTKMNKLIDDIFNNLGFSIRMCNNIKDCISEAEVIINLSKKEELFKHCNKKKKTVVLNVDNNLAVYHQNISILNGINIDISTKFRLPFELENIYKYCICEMYILSSLDKLYLLRKQNAFENFEDIYQCFKQNNFKIGSLEGINL